MPRHAKWQYDPDAQVEEVHFVCAGNIIVAASVASLEGKPGLPPLPGYAPT
ncbi:MAG: hypothetical protein ACREDT_03480 [Methylocella sp.]